LCTSLVLCNFTAHIKSRISVRKAKRCELFRGIIAMCYENHTNTQTQRVGKVLGILISKQVAHTIPLCFRGLHENILKALYRQKRR
jgi:hypothetical protein